MTAVLLSPTGFLNSIFMGELLESWICESREGFELTESTIQLEASLNVVSAIVIYLNEPVKNCN
jgi:hypothetical protein